MTKFPLSLAQLAEICDGQVVGDGSLVVDGVCSIEQQRERCLAYVGTPTGGRKIKADSGVLYLLKPDDAKCINHGVAHDNPTQAFRLILVAMQQPPHPGIAETAQIAATARLGEQVTIGHHVIIEDGVSIGDNCVLDSGCVVRRNSSIGDYTRLGSGVSIHNHCRIGKHCIIADNSVIGGQGFGFSFEGGSWQAIPQIGGVVVGDAVHIGSNVCIDRGAINDTVIGDNVIIDNLVHIAHNVQVGEGTAMAAQVGIAGSTIIGKHCMLGGQVGVVGHISISDAVQVNGGARILQSLKDPGTYAGSFHVQPVRRWNRLAAYMKKLEILFKREKNSE